MRRETGDLSQETGDERWETGDVKKETQDRKRENRDGRWFSDVMSNTCIAFNLTGEFY